MKCRMRAVLKWMTVVVVFFVGSAQAFADDGEVVEGDVDEESVPVEEMEQGTPGEVEVTGDEVLTANAEDPRQLSWRWLIGGQVFELTAGIVWYLTDEETNEVDWDYSGIYTSRDVVEEGNMGPRELRPQRERWRGLDGFRFEDNVMVLNSPLHPMAGAGYYILARSASAGMAGSALTAQVSSLVWEGAIEHMEVFSINDQLLTAAGGVALGEAYFQLGDFFRRAEPTRFNRSMAWVFGFPSQLRDRIHGYDAPQARAYGDHGWPEEIWNRFTIEPAFSVASTRAEGEEGFGDPRFDGELAVAMEISNLPDYRRSGEHSRWISGPLYSSLSANLAMGSDVHDWGLRSELDFAGYYRHDLRGEDVGSRRGTSLFVGTGLGFRHVQHRFDDAGAFDERRFLDRHGIVHFPGLRLDASWFTGVADVRLRYGLTPDFAAMESRAYRDFRAAGQEEYQGFQTVVEKEGYYYGAGFSSLVDLEVTIDPVHLHWGWDLHWTSSIDRADRFKDFEEFEGYLSMTDLVSTHEVGAMFDIPVSNLRAGVRGEYRQRSGTLQEPGEEGDFVESQSSELRGLGVLQLSY